MPPAPRRSSTSPGPGVGHVGRFDAQVFLGVNAAGKHGDLLECRSVRRYCSVSQPVREALVRLVQVPLHRGARAAGVACAAIAFSTDAVLGHRGCPQRRRVVVMLELLVERPGALLPQHLDHRHQRAVAGRLGDAQVEQPVAGQRLLARSSSSRCICVERLLDRLHLRLLRRLRRQRRALALDHVARAQQLERARPSASCRPAAVASRRPAPARRCPSRCAPRPGPRPPARSAPRAPTAATRRAASRGRAPAAAARRPEIRRDVISVADLVGDLPIQAARFDALERHGDGSGRCGRRGRQRCAEVGVGEG